MTFENSDLLVQRWKNSFIVIRGLASASQLDMPPSFVGRRVSYFSLCVLLCLLLYAIYILELFTHGFG